MVNTMESEAVPELIVCLAHHFNRNGLSTISLFPTSLVLGPCSLLFVLDDFVRGWAYSRTMAQVERFSVDAHAIGFLWISPLFVSSLLPY